MCVVVERNKTNSKKWEEKVRGQMSRRSHCGGGWHPLVEFLILVHVLYGTCRDFFCIVCSPSKLMHNYVEHLGANCSFILYFWRKHATFDLLDKKALADAHLVHCLPTLSQQLCFPGEHHRLCCRGPQVAKWRLTQSVFGMEKKRFFFLLPLSRPRIMWLPITLEPMHTLRLGYGLQLLYM